MIVGVFCRLMLSEMPSLSFQMVKRKVELLERVEGKKRLLLERERESPESCLVPSKSLALIRNFPLQLMS